MSGIALSLQLLFTAAKDAEAANVEHKRAISELHSHVRIPDADSFAKAVERRMGLRA